MNCTPLLPEFKTAPAVFAVKNTYQIMVPVKSDLLFWVTVGGREFHDHSNGIIRSSTRMHRVSVPMKLLDEAGVYTVSYRKIIHRKPYRTETEEVVSAVYPFKPVPAEGPINIYHLSDTHGHYDLPASAAGWFGENIDLLILNGDIPDHSGAVENFDLIYRLCETITRGERPVIFSRGNHDTRGFFAENIADYTPTENGHSYFSFRLGRLWGIVLDCGEDKNDDHVEYGHTVCCHEFRLAETDYLKEIVKNAASEYAADGVTYRLVIVHNPFTHTLPAPFDIEQDTFGEWNDLLGRYVHPQAMIAGHLHTIEISPVGGQLDDKGQHCPVIVAAKPVQHYQDFMGSALTLDGGKMIVRFTDSSKTVNAETTLDLIP